MPEPSETPNVPAAEQPLEAATSKRKRGGWMRRLVLLGSIGLAALLALVGFLPSIVSTQVGREFVVARAGGFLNGELDVEDWSLSWTGPQRIGAVRLTDSAQREVLSVQSVSSQHGLWQLLTGSSDLGEIRVDTPQVLLHFNEDGTVSLADALPAGEPVPETAAAEPFSLPDISARLVVTDGSVELSRDGLPSYTISELALDAGGAVRRDLNASLAATLPDGRKLSGEVALKDLAADGPLALQDANGTATLKTDAEIEIGPLVSVLTGSADLTGRALVDVDLAAQEQDVQFSGLVKVFELASPQADGTLNLGLTAKGNLAGDELTAEAELAGSSARFMTVAARGTLDDASADFSADLAGLRKELATVFDLGTLEFGGQAEGTARLTRADQGGYNTELSLKVREAALVSGTQDLRARDLELSQTGQFGAADAQLRSSGSLKIAGLAAGGKQLDDQAEVSWTDLVYAEGIRAQSVQVAASPLTLDAQGLGVSLETGSLDSGTLDLKGSVAETLQLLAAAGALAEPPALSGQFEFAGQATAANGNQRLQGTGAIRQLVIGEGEQAVREERVTLALDATVNTAAQRLELGENRIQSEQLNLAVRGSVTDLGGQTLADLSGDYELSWEATTALLHELVPNTRELVRAKGRSASPLTFSGPLNDPAAQPSFRPLLAETALQWDQIEVMGIPISGAELKPRLADAALTVPPVTLTAVEGRLNVGATLDLQPGAAALRMPGTTKLLEGVMLTPELTRDLLSRINPLFYSTVETSGQVSLTTVDLVLPLDGSPADTAAGRGSLELVDMRIRPAGLVSELVALAGLGSTDELLAIQLYGGDFEIRAGRVHYDGLSVIFPNEFDLRFSGSVGFDDTLDLVVSIPVRADLLARLGVPGDAQRYVELLDGTRVDVPLAGTRQNPTLSLDAIDVQKLLGNVAEAQLKDNAGKLLGDALGGQLAADETPVSDDSPTTQPGKPPGRGLLEKLKERKQKQKKRSETPE